MPSKDFRRFLLVLAFLTVLILLTQWHASSPERWNWTAMATVAAMAAALATGWLGFVSLRSTRATERLAQADAARMRFEHEPYLLFSWTRLFPSGTSFFTSPATIETRLQNVGNGRALGISICLSSDVSSEVAELAFRQTLEPNEVAEGRWQVEPQIANEVFRSGRGRVWAYCRDLGGIWHLFEAHSGLEVERSIVPSRDAPQAWRCGRVQRTMNPKG